MQQQQRPVTPGTPDSANVLLYNTGNAASEKRNKSIMNCFRDRTPSYTRSNSRQLIRYDGPMNRPEQITILREPFIRPRPTPNKLALLKSSSASHGLNRIGTGTAPTVCSESSMSSNSSAGSRKRTVVSTNVDMLEQRITKLEKELQEEREFTKQLQIKLNALSQRVEEFQTARQTEKSKKSNSFYKKRPTNEQAPAVQPSRLAAWMKLSNFWKHRPSIQTLKEQNIYNDEPCFDTEIESVIKHEVHKTIPKVVVDCCDLIEEKYRKSSEPVEGIYRQCGDYNKIQTLRFSIDANDYGSLRQANIDIHTLSGVLKLFLREIKSPLISTNEAKTFIGKPNQWLLTELMQKIEILKRLIRSLPEVNRNTLDYLFAHFNRLTKVPLQHVSAETLSLSITPSIFHTVQNDVHIQDIQQLLKENEVLADCVKIMIQYQSRIFEFVPESKLRRISVRQLRKTLSHPDLLFQSFF